MAKQMIASKKGSAEGRNADKCQTVTGARPRKAVVKKERSGAISK